MKKFQILVTLVVLSLVAIMATPAMAKDDGLVVTPDSGHYNYTPSFTVTNVSDHEIVVAWLLDCESRTENVGKPAMKDCHNRTGEVTLQPGDSFSEGFGEVCLTWQFDILSDGSGYVVEPQNCKCKTGTCKTKDPVVMSAQCLIPLAGRIVEAKIGKTKISFIDVPAVEAGKPSNVSFGKGNNDLIASGEAIHLKLDTGEDLTLIITQGVSYGDPDFKSWGANGCYYGSSSTWGDGNKPSSARMIIGEKSVVRTEPCVLETSEVVVDDNH